MRRSLTRNRIGAKVSIIGGISKNRRSSFLSKKIYLPIITLSLALLVFYFVLYSSKIRTVVEERIYRSPQLSANYLEKSIKDKGIKTIINLRGEGKDSQWYIKEGEISQKYHLKLYDCRLSAYDLPRYRILRDILEVLSTSERPILIHCGGGVDRTGFVSALALAIERDLPLSELKKQFSWRYGVLPFYRSIGPYFFSNYEQWLDKTHRTHSKENLLYWINHEYVDYQGNIEFYVDSINGKLIKEKFILLKNSKTVHIEGWAFDARTNSPVEGLHFVIDDQTSIKPERQNRPDVAKFYGIKGYDENFMAGWKVVLDRTPIGEGCHKISIRITKDELSRLDIPTKVAFCFE